MSSRTLRALPLLALLTLPLAAQQPDTTKPSESGAVPPKTWVDKDTGHRVWRVSDEPNSGAFYFNVPAYTPDHKSDGLQLPQRHHGPRPRHHEDPASSSPIPRPPTHPQAAELAAAGRPRHRRRPARPTASSSPAPTPQPTPTPSTKPTPTPEPSASSSISPARLGISSINADETLGVGTYNESDVPGKDPNAPNAFVANAPPPPPAANANASANPTLGGANVQSDDKGEMMERRLAARIPVVMFTIRLEPGPNGEKPGHIKILFHSTDWIGHMLFSPTDPTLHHVLPRRHVAEGRPHLAHPHRRLQQHPHPQTHHGHGDRRPRVLGPRRQDHLVRLAVPQGRRLLPRRLQPQHQRDASPTTCSATTGPFTST